MPFGRKNHAQTEAGAAGYADQTANQNYSTNGPMGTGAGPAMNPATQDTSNTRGHHTAGTGAGAYQQGMTNLPPQDAQGASVSDPYSNTVANNDVAPVNHFSTGQRTGHASSTSGKIERVIGTIICSPTMKAKGAEKEREAQSLQMQRAEITEAERLEHEAQLRRNRAVQHGAHPSNKALGGAAQAQEFGGNFGNTASAGAGPGAGNSSLPMGRGGAM